MNIDELKEASIFVVDDNPNNLSAVVGHLAQFGLKPIPLKSGEEALKLVEKRQPDIILLDVQMPGGIDGFETCRRLKANPKSRNIPVIFVTAASETVDKVTGFSLGGVDYITKPVQAEELLSRIYVHFTIRRLQQELLEANRNLEEKVLARTEALMKANKALKESEQHLKLAIQAGQLGIWDWHIATNQVTWSDNVEQIFGLKPGSFTGTYEAYLDLIHPGDKEHLFKTIRNAIDNHENYYIEHRILGLNGLVRWLEGVGEVYYDDNNQPVRMIGVVHDITTRKQTEKQIRASLQEKEVLLKEIHHRVKNNMQVISSLLDLQADTIQDEQMHELFKESQSRVKSMALVHERLYQSKDLARIDFADYVESLTHHLLRSYGARLSGVETHIDIAPISLSLETAIPCGLIINELVSNAFKHAFSKGQVGQIWIELHPIENRQVILRIKDNGGGFPPEIDFRRTTSLGLTLVNTLVRQLKGTIEVRSESGTEFNILFSDPAAKTNGLHTG